MLLRKTADRLAARQSRHVGDGAFAGDAVVLNNAASVASADNADIAIRAIHAIRADTLDRLLAPRSAPLSARRQRNSPFRQPRCLTRRPSAGAVGGSGLTGERPPIHPAGRSPRSPAGARRLGVAPPLDLTCRNHEAVLREADREHNSGTVARHERGAA